MRGNPESALVQRFPKENDQHDHEHERQDHQPAQRQAAGEGLVVLGLVDLVLGFCCAGLCARSVGALCVV